MPRRLFFALFLGTSLSSCSAGLEISPQLEEVSYVVAEVFSAMDEALYVAGGQSEPGFSGTCFENVPTCSNGAATAVFDAGCDLGRATLTAGGTLFDFSGATCAFAIAGMSVLSRPNYTYVGPRENETELTTSSTQGYTMSFDSETLPANSTTAIRSYSFGVVSFDRNVYSASDSTVLSHTATVSTGTDITITEQFGRRDRELSGGQLSVSVVNTQLQSLGAFTLSPSSDPEEIVGWGSNCSCPTEGKMEGTYVDGAGQGYVFAVEATAICGNFRLYVDNQTGTIDVPHCEAL